MTRISVPRSSRWVAKECRSAWSVTPLRIPAASAASWNMRLSWRVVIGLPGLWPGNSQRSSMGVVESKPRRRVFHHWRSRSSVSGDSMTLRSLRLLDPNDLLRAVDVLDLQPDHLAGAQAAAIAETEQYTHLEAARDREQAPGLVLAHHQRNLLRLTEVINLGRKIQSPQRHAKQEPHPGHDAVAIADARARLGKMQLKPADILRRGRVRGPLEKCSKQLAAGNIAPLRPRAEFAGIHVLDHALAQRADRNLTHGQLLLWMRLMTPPSSRQADMPAIDDLSLVTAPSGRPPLQRAIAQRFSAMATFGHANRIA